MMTIVYTLLALILVYFIVLHGIYLLLVLLGSIQIRQYNRGITFAEFDRIAKSDLSMPVSIIVPAHNESAIIINTTENLLRLNYPAHEVIVVDDGSTDHTLAVLIDHFHLRRVDRHGPKRIETEKVTGVYESADFPNLVVVTKENGRRADAINAAVPMSRYPLLLVTDADSVLEPDGLLHMARPFLLDSHLAASAGVVRPSNGLVMENGVILRRGLPPTMLGLNQEVEYARSFQWSRTGLCRLNCMLCISGALLLVKKNIFENLGGSWAQAITDDIEFTIRLHKHLFDRREKNGGKLVFTPDAVCFTEVPESPKLYASQRNRWQRGTLEALFRNWRMIFNPRYGLTGLFGMPFFIIFEAFAPLVEITAYTLAVILLATGVVGWTEVIILFFLAYILGVFLSLLAVLLTEMSRLRTASWRDFWKMIAAILTDNLGYHQWRQLAALVGMLQFFLYRRRDLGARMERISVEPATV
jgi:cellulose synthase/poly-beta-1,6-N-acetylglucosamine synthase-like glycosyltransferase